MPAPTQAYAHPRLHLFTVIVECAVLASYRNNHVFANNQNGESLILGKMKWGITKQRLYNDDNGVGRI